MSYAEANNPVTTQMTGEQDHQLETIYSSWFLFVIVNWLLLP
jgi:hypothetical protein